MKRREGKFTLSPKRSLAVVSQILVVLFASILIFFLTDRFLIHPPVEPVRADDNSPTKVEKLIQVSVRNECGVRNVALDFTSYLRKRGFDVVETANGGINNRQITTVVDASGNYQNALRVAEALGVHKENVFTKLDPQSYVDVKVLIGKDYQNLSQGSASSKTK